MGKSHRAQQLPLARPLGGSYSESVACSHVTTCPLFPKLNASLAGWRDAYCNTATEYITCARYQMSKGGSPVPLALLPNGKMVDAIANAESQASRPQETPVRVMARTAVATEAPAPQGFFARLAAWFGGKS